MSHVSEITFSIFMNTMNIKYKKKWCHNFFDLKLYKMCECVHIVHAFKWQIKI